MDRERATRLLTAGVSMGIVLLFILLSIFFYQLVLIQRTRAQINDLQKEIEILQEQNEQTSDEIDVWLNNWKITERANELGYLYGEN